MLTEIIVLAGLIFKSAVFLSFEVYNFLILTYIPLSNNLVKSGMRVDVLIKAVDFDFFGALLPTTLFSR